MTYEQLSPDLEAKLQQEAEIDVLVRKIEDLVTGYDVGEILTAAKVMSSVPHFTYSEGGVFPESIRDQIHRVVTEEGSR